jgi:hypothetical protein
VAATAQAHISSARKAAAHAVAGAALQMASAAIEAACKVRV